MKDAARRRPTGPGVWDEVWDNRWRLVRELAPGKSFLDLGGMYGVAGEIAFRAERSGARRVVLFDGMDASDEFAEKHRANGSSVQFIQGDLHDPGAVAALGQFDIVWCTGVIYHTPNPMQQLLHLRQLTGEHLVLGSLVIPELPGIEQGCIFYPGISDEFQDTFARAHGGRERFPGMAVPFDPTPLMAYANMWFGISPSALRGMLRFAGFDVTDEYMVSPFSIDLLARPGGQPTDIYPPHGQSRQRVRQRFAEIPPDQVPRWAETQLREIRNSQASRATDDGC